MTDPLIYPVAAEFIPFGARVHTDGLRATLEVDDNANGEAVAPSFRGDATGYEAGQTIRVRPISEEISE